MWLPHGVDGGQRAPVALQPQLLLGVLVGQQAGFSQQRLVLELSARQLPVHRLQAKEEHAVTKPTAPQSSVRTATSRRSASVSLYCYRGDGASAIQTRSMLQASTGSCAAE